MAMKLYEISSNYREALEHFSDPERFQDGIDTLDSIQEDMNAKLDNIGRLRQEYLVEAEAYEAEIKRLKEKQERAKKQATSLEGYVEYTMRQNKFDKIKTALFEYSFTTSTSLVATDVDKMPEHFLKPQPPKPDIAGLKKHLKQVYEEKGIKLVSKLTGKPGEMLYTDLDLEELGVKYEVSEKLKVK